MTWVEGQFDRVGIGFCRNNGIRVRASTDISTKPHPIEKVLFIQNNAEIVIAQDKVNVELNTTAARP